MSHRRWRWISAAVFDDARRDVGYARTRKARHRGVVCLYLFVARARTLDDDDDDRHVRHARVTRARGGAIG